MTISRELYLYLTKSYIYVKTLGKITSLYILGDVAACRRAACVLCAVQSELTLKIFVTHCRLTDHHVITSLFLILVSAVEIEPETF